MGLFDNGTVNAFVEFFNFFIDRFLQKGWKS